MSTERLQDHDRLFFTRGAGTHFYPTASLMRTPIYGKGKILWRILGAPADVGYSEYCDLMSGLHIRSARHAAAIPSVQPDGAGSFEEPNAWIARAAARALSCRGLFFVRPTDDPEWVRQKCVGRAHGLKRCLSGPTCSRPGKLKFPTICPAHRADRPRRRNNLVITAHGTRTRGRRPVSSTGSAATAGLFRYASDPRAFGARLSAGPQCGRLSRVSRPRQSLL